MKVALRIPNYIDRLIFYGVHFDLTFPLNPSVEVTGGRFELISNTGTFGIGPGLPRNIPDNGSTLLLLVVSVVGFCAFPILPRR
jgi:hypothetical protein